MDGNFPVLIPANKILKFPCGDATVFGVVTTTAAFSVRERGGSKSLLDSGESIGSAGGEELGFVTLYNSTGTAIEATIYVGSKEFKSAKVNVHAEVETLATLSLVESVPVSGVYPIAANDTVEQIAAASEVYVSSIEFFPGKSVADGVITPNDAGDIYIGRTATQLPYKRGVADTDYPVVFTAPAGQKIPLSVFRVKGQAGDGVAYTYTPA